MTDIYRSETHRVPVEITFLDGTVLTGDVHLQPNTMLCQGHEPLIELLNRPDPFFAVSLDSDQVVLLAKKQTALVSCGRDGNGANGAEFPGTVANLDIWLASGGRHRGTAAWQLPPAHSRPLDFMNTSGSFLELVEGDQARYINVANIRAVFPG